MTTLRGSYPIPERQDKQKESDVEQANKSYKTINLHIKETTTRRLEVGRQCLPPNSVKYVNNVPNVTHFQLAVLHKMKEITLRDFYSQFKTIQFVK
jgi:hypothetical protein